MVKCLKCGEEKRLRITYAGDASRMENCAIVQIEYEAICPKCGDITSDHKCITVEVP